MEIPGFKEARERELVELEAQGLGLTAVKAIEDEVEAIRSLGDAEDWRAAELRSDRLFVLSQALSELSRALHERWNEHFDQVAPGMSEAEEGAVMGSCRAADEVREHAFRVQMSSAPLYFALREQCHTGRLDECVRNLAASSHKKPHPEHDSAPAGPAM